MEITESHTFDAPIDRVWAMFTDEASHIAKFESMGHRDIEVLESESSDEGLRLVIKRVVEVDLPGFARKVLKPTNTVITTDTWRDNGDGTYGGSFELETVGAPVESSGTTKIWADGDKTAYEVTVRFDVKVPLVGGKITKWAAGDVSSQLDKEFAAGDDWLTEHP